MHHRHKDWELRLPAASSSPRPLKPSCWFPVLLQELKRREVCASLPVVPIYSPECWQDGCDLVNPLGSSSAPSDSAAGRCIAESSFSPLLCFPFTNQPHSQWLHRQQNPTANPGGPLV